MRFDGDEQADRDATSELHPILLSKPAGEAGRLQTYGTGSS
jgi:hypothetical protein